MIRISSRDNEIRKHIKDFVVPNDEYFGWYNPKTKEVVYGSEYRTKPSKPDDNGPWYNFHNHPKGTDTNPSEIDMFDSLFENNTEPQYVYSDKGMTVFQMTNPVLTKQKLEELYKKFNANSLQELIKMHNYGPDEYMAEAANIVDNPQSAGFKVTKYSPERSPNDK